MAARLRIAARYTGYTLGAGAVTGAAVGTYVYNTEPGARRAVRFWVVVGPIVANYSWARFWGKDKEDRTARYQELHTRHAPDARLIIEELRGMFVKVAQVMSVRPEVVPEPYRIEFRKLQSSAPASNWEVVKETLERDLGAPLDQVFDWIREEPLGAASIGQAHLVGFKGRQAVVKVQYPDAASMMHADFWCVETLMRILGEEDGVQVIKRVKQQFEVELDYASEAKHLSGVADALEQCAEASCFLGKVVVPRPISELTSGSVLGMEYLEGPKLETVCLERLKALGMGTKGSFDDWLAERTKEDSQEVSRFTEAAPADDLLDANGDAVVSAKHKATSQWARVGKWVLRAVGLDVILKVVGWFADLRLRLTTTSSSLPSTAELREVLHTVLDVHGFELFFSPYFNGDPHPGNLLLMPDGKIGLIDFGQCVSLEPEHRRGLANLLVALDDAEGDAPGDIADRRIASAFFAAGITTRHGNEQFAALLAKLMFVQLTPDILDHEKLHRMLREDKVDHMPLQVMMAYRTSMLLRGLCLVLQENVSVAHLWRPWAEAWLKANPA